jgi:hypothetical protein
MRKVWLAWAVVAGLGPQLSACVATPNPAPSPSAGATTLAQRPKGQAATTQIQLQRFKTLFFRSKANGAILAPESAAELPPEAVNLEVGDWDQLDYEAGRLRYTSFPREREAQPLVVDRAYPEASFEALDVALWTDPYFSSPSKNWDAKTRLPLYLLRYQQNGKGHEASFTPSLTAKLPRSSAILEALLAQLSGQSLPPAGVSHVLYGLSLNQKQCEVQVSQLKAAGNDADSSPLKLSQVQVDLGAGPQAATIGPKGFSFVAPTTAGEVAVVATLTPEGGSPWKVVLPVRVP